MTFDPLAIIVAELDRFAIPYMLAGSFASTYYGDPRTTHDIDFVIAPTKTQLLDLVAGLDSDRYYVSDIAAVEAWNRRGMFNVVLVELGWKVDLILCKDRDFSRSEFERRRRITVGGLEVWMATAEDTIVAKLEWARAGESERQVRDVVGILQVSDEALDRVYIERWVAELELDALWQRVSSEAQSPRHPRG